jgi:hypothetical protein
MAACSKTDLPAKSEDSFYSNSLTFAARSLWCPVGLVRLFRCKNRSFRMIKTEAPLVAGRPIVVALLIPPS